MANGPTLQEIMHECYKDTRKAAEVFLPHRFWRKFDDKLHGPIFDLIDNSDNPRKAIAAPRGTGKTSIVNLLVPFKRIIFQDARFIVPVSATADMAQQRSEDLKEEIVDNQLVQHLYNDVQTGKFNKLIWAVNIMGMEVGIMPRGAGQKVRGLLYRGFRPDLLLVDDLEDPSEVDTEEQRAKKNRWFKADLLNCVDRGKGSKWEVVVLGTVLHQASLLEELLEDKNWDSVRLRICDDSLQSLAPNFIPTSEIVKMYNEHKERNELDIFFREYWNNPIPRVEDAVFQQQFFIPYSPDQINLDTDPNVENFVLVDIAKTTKMNSAHSAVVGVAVNLKTNTVYVRDIVEGKFHPEELYEEICDMIVRIRARVLGVEVTSLHEFVTYPLRNELVRRNLFVEVIELHARGGSNEKGKITRIKSLLPFYRQGLVRHNPACCAVLEGQLMSFPFGKRVDVIDAFGYLPELLEMGSRFMYHTEDTWDTKKIVEAEYAEFENDPVDLPLTNFRLV